MARVYFYDRNDKWFSTARVPSRYLSETTVHYNLKLDIEAHVNRFGHGIYWQISDGEHEYFLTKIFLTLQGEVEFNGYEYIGMLRKLHRLGLFYLFEYEK